MTKAELVQHLSDKTGVSKVQAAAVLDELSSTIVTQTLKRGNPITLTGLGTFKQKKRAARDGRNPSTGEALRIKASTGLGFKMSSTLKA